MISAIFSVILIVWLASGVGNERVLSEPLLPPTEAFQVSSFISEAQSHRRNLTLRGRIEVDKSIVLRSKVAGEVVRTPFREGDLVESGDVICELEVGERDAALVRAQSAVKLAEIDFEAAQQLNRDGLQSRIALARAEDQLAAARLAERQARLALEYTKIRAPFDGVVETLRAEHGSYLRPGDHCALLLDVTPLVFAGLASEDYVSYLHASQPGVVSVSGLGSFSAELRFVSQQADDITRNYLVESVISVNETSPLRAGLTAAMTIPLDEVRAHLVPASIISLDAQGGLRVKAVNDDNRVVYFPIDLVDETQEGLWVVGLPDRIRLVTVGSEFVAEGDEVIVRSIEAQ